MGTYKKRTATNGFTLIEMLIISILALIVIPRLLSAGRRAKESNLRAQLHEMRTAIAKFKADLGDNPLSSIT